MCERNSILLQYCPIKIKKSITRTKSTLLSDNIVVDDGRIIQSTFPQITMKQLEVV